MVDRLELERRVMIAALVSTCVAAVIWLTAISTDEWCSVTFDDWQLINSSSSTTSSSNTRTYVRRYNMGLWKLCAYLYFNATNTSRTTGPGNGFEKSPSNGIRYFSAVCSTVLVVLIKLAGYVV